MGFVRWMLRIALGIVVGLFALWVFVHLALAGLLVGAAGHILYSGFQGIEAYIIAIGIGFVVIAILRSIFIPRW
jgi:hypothetical protein